MERSAGSKDPGQASDDWKVVVIREEREKPEEKEEKVAYKWAKLLRKHGHKKASVDLPHVRSIPEQSGIKGV